ncbi:MAG: PilZ domain-containing protein [Thermoanaerobaculia bacterium]|nr:PilZ domain-containing protein [Thermoanaerobaculia bacterium]
MDRRRERRWPRVLDVRFRKRGEEEKPHRAVATNISKGGMFIRTSAVLPSGTRVRVEVVHARHGFMVEGVVVRALRTPTHLQTVRPSGMGVRFLPPGELVEELLPHMATSKASDSREGQAEKREGAESPAESPADSRRAPSGRETGPRESSTMELEDRVFEVSFQDRDWFRAVFDRDVQTGGIFVPSDEPAAIDEVVKVEISIEGAGSARLEARVVHSVPPGDEAVEGQNVLSGMGVQFSDVPRAVERLRKLLD